MIDKPHKQQTGNLVGHYLHTNWLTATTLSVIDNQPITIYRNMIHELPTVNVHIYTQHIEINIHVLTT